jgi:hypothetical protein
MSESSEKKITIKIEIQVPVGEGGGAPVVTATTCQQEPTFHLMSGIDQPVGSNVKCRIGDTDGTVCAAGDALEGVDKALKVGLKIFQGAPVLTQTPAPYALWTPVDQTTGRWGPTDVGGVAGYPAITPQILACWAMWPDYHYSLHRTSNFSPYWGLQTECDGARQKAPMMDPKSAYELIPIAWTLKTQGFSGGALTQINGDWTLRVVQATEVKILYCNGGDVESTPRIRLELESPSAPFWKLSFEFGASQITYGCAAPQFDGQGRNIFRKAITSGLGEESGIPAVVSILPA